MFSWTRLIRKLVEGASITFSDSYANAGCDRRRKDSLTSVISATLRRSNNSPREGVRSVNGLRKEGPRTNDEATTKAANLGAIALSVQIRTTKASV